jgi:Tol biopolymer transport system component
MCRRLTIVLLAALGCGAVLKERMNSTPAADGGDATWGAADPAWSPDGSALVFSLFGSIWRISPEGGEAEQLTSSPGYHAHPAWSPAGSKVAFVKGQPPATGEIFPQITGNLVVLDVATGREREIPTGAPVFGSVAWSPDGTRIACALGPALHEISVANGSIRSLQPGGGRGAPAWMPVAWNPERDELFFTGSRGRGPQVWSMYPLGAPITVQMPLTRYGPEDNIVVHSLAAMPDGSAVVFSANPVNRAGNYDIYRVPQQGGRPVPITNTPRDEFSPAVSPDGRRIALVSNQMDNTDLFTMPIAGGAQRHVRISGLKFRGPSGKLHVQVRDELGRPTPVRLYVRASDGRAYCPPGSPIFYLPLEAGRERDGFFISSGEDTLSLPAGTVRLVALKGVEYEIAERSLDIPANETAAVTISMLRWTNWTQRGWYSGENHIHPNYGGIYYIRPQRILQWIDAEDLNAANLLVANFSGSYIHDKEFFRGALDPLSNAEHFLYYGQEYRNASPLGHMAFLNIKRRVPPSYTSVPASDSPYDFPLNTMAALEARKQGGVVSYVHPIGTARDVFDVNIGAKEAPIAAAFGAMDSIDVLPGGGTAYDLWYAFLNCGFQFAPGAGTDTFTNRRGIFQIPGGVREYVEVGSVMNWDRWMERYREGRNFVTNGPLVTFTVNGSPMGSEIRVPSGQVYRARLEAEVTSRVPLRVVEFVQNGKIIATRELSAGTRSVKVEEQVPVEGSCWFAVRASGPEARGVLGRFPMAHSGAIYVSVGGRPTLVRQDLELMIRWIDRLWLSLEERNNFGPGDNRERARKMIGEARRHFEEKLAAARAPGLALDE